MASPFLHAHSSPKQGNLSFLPRFYPPELTHLQDQTFTCTLFAPSTEFDRLTTPDTIIEWFKLYFPDALTLMGEENVLKNFAQNPRSALICTKVRTSP